MYLYLDTKTVMRSQIQNLLKDAAEIHSVKYVIRFGMSISNGIRKLFHS